MTLAMSRPWKHPNSGVYWLRKRVPDDLRALIGKREEKRSLGTKISSSRDQGGLRLPRRGSSASGSGILFPGKVDFRRIVWERER
jgi:hypothetical protein